MVVGANEKRKKRLLTPQSSSVNMSTCQHRQPVNMGTGAGVSPNPVGRAGRKCASDHGVGGGTDMVTNQRVINLDKLSQPRPADLQSPHQGSATFLLKTGQIVTIRAPC